MFFLFLITAYVLFQIEANKDILCSKQTNNVINKMKTQKWEEIAKKVTAGSGVIRSASELKQKWSDLQRRTKERNTKYKKEKRRTGGEPPPQKMSQQDEQILNVIGSTGVEGIFGGVDTVEEVDDIETMSATSETSSVASSVTNSVKIIRESGLNMSLHSQDADFHDLGMMDRANEAAVESMVRVNPDGFLSPRNLKETDSSETSVLQFLRPNKTINP